VRSWRRTGNSVPSNTRQDCRESSDGQTCESVGGREKALENRRRGRNWKRCWKRGGKTHDFATENLLVLIVEEGKRVDGGRLWNR
jgi:hypothetical protein